MNEVVLHL